MPGLKSCGQEEVLQIFMIASDVLSVTFLRGLDPSPLNKWCMKWMERGVD